MENPFVPEVKEAKEEKVAVIGAGPAGLTAAYYLAIEGYQVTVFEKLPVLGGMLTVGIPSYRLPRDIIDAEIQVIRNMGVEFRTGVEIGTDMTFDQLRQDGFKAFFIGIGAHKSRFQGIEGEDLEGVYPGVDFLRETNLGNDVSVGDRVAVIGGGNVAMDAVRTALRSGSANPFVIYRRSYNEMPANEIEIEECSEEGIEIMTLTNPVRIIGDSGRVKAIECVKMKLGVPDASGRRRPEPIPGSEFTMEVDAVIPAIGQQSDWTCLEAESDCRLSRWGTMAVDPVTYQTGKQDIFAGGDAVQGPATVVEAIGAGKEAAVSIDRFLQGQDLSEGREKDWTPVKDVPVEGFDKIPRENMTCLAPDERKTNFNEVQLGFDQGQADQESDRCLECGICSECYQCVDACLAEAVDHSQVPIEKEIPVGSVILSPGCDTYDPSVLDEHYHYSTNPNVMTSLEFERVLSASGPTQGHLVRMSDNKEPKKIAWLQCIGSRDTHRCGNSYCSSVCCMYAVKDAMIAKEHSKEDLDCVVFNMDMRTVGKDYEQYYLRAKEKEGVRFVRGRVHTVDELTESDNLRVRFADEQGKICHEDFDIVVLSVGLSVSEDTVKLAERLGVDMNSSHFADTDPFMPVETSRPGIYACGIFQGPKDIPGSVTEAGAAACLAGTDIAEGRDTETKTIEIPEQKDVSKEDPRIGVFVCNCGTNIGGIVDVPGVAKYAASLPNVVYTDENLFTCSQDSQERIKEKIVEENLNRVVVASCSPKTHAAMFMETVEAAGLNKYLFEMANIRNQTSWVHAHEPDKATEKSKDLVRMAVARTRDLVTLKESTIPVNKRALVIGGGIAGMNAALGIAGQGFEVVLAEKEPVLGGNALNLYSTIEGSDVRNYLKKLIEGVSTNKDIEVITDAGIIGFEGYKGNFTTKLTEGREKEPRIVDHGVVIISTGAGEYRPTEYHFEESDRVVTQMELGTMLEEKGASGLSSVVMIQCVGSRNEEYPECSRVCCQAAVKNALHIKTLRPKVQVYVLYRDIRTYGLLEDYYARAREGGVIFIRFEDDDPPEVKQLSDDKGSLAVTVSNSLLQRDIEISADLVVLSAGVRAGDINDLSSLMKLNRNPDGYLIEAHVKLRPVDMSTEGIFLCGMAHGPKLISEAISQAQAAASRAVTYLSKSALSFSAITATLNRGACVKCLSCVRACPFEVPVLNKELHRIEIDEALCHGCGVCVGVCPKKAIGFKYYENNQIMNMIDAMFEGDE